MCSGISVSIVGTCVVSQHGVFVNRLTNGHSSTFSAFIRGLVWMESNQHTVDSICDKNGKQYEHDSWIEKGE